MAWSRAHFAVWQPLPNISDEFVLENIIHKEDGIEILLRNRSGRTLSVLVPTLLEYGYHSRDYFAQDAPEDLLHSFWRSESSERLSIMKASGFDSDIALWHYVIETKEGVLEFISDQSVQVSWLDSFFGDAD